jgi:hypothetical protein
MWGFLAGAALSLIGGLFSRPEPQPEPPPLPPPPPPAPAPQVVVQAEQKSDVDLKKLVTDSEEAGFNPLTVLRNGGVAGYQRTSVPFLTTNSAYVDWETGNQYATTKYNYDAANIEREWNNRNAQKQWLGSMISSVGGMVSNFGEKFNPTVMAQAEERRMLENDLLRSEIYRNGATSVTRFGQQNSSYGSNYRAGAGEVYSAQNGIDIWGGSPQSFGYEDNPPTLTNPAPSWWKRTNIFGDAENWETAYAELVSLPVGVLSLGADSIKTAAYWGSRGITSLIDNGYISVSPAPKGSPSFGLSIDWPTWSVPKPAPSGGGGW